ncbi:5833_t:CDS:1, partial [Racocetra persica]
MGKFTTCPTQYMPLCNPDKYEHIYDQATDFITVKNIKQDRVIGVFDYSELYEYLGVANPLKNVCGILFRQLLRPGDI